MSVDWDNVVHADALNRNQRASPYIESQTVSHEPDHRVGAYKILAYSAQQVNNSMVFLNLGFIGLQEFVLYFRSHHVIPQIGDHFDFLVIFQFLEIEVKLFWH